jgi:two-component system, chemotaxis family, protein-glutamate methylesterase/glutaminase
MNERPPAIRALFIEGSVFPSGPAADMTRGEEGIEVFSAAADPFAARERIVEFQPDVVVLDLETERMDAMLFLKILMEQSPMPVVAMSSLTPQGSRLALDALELGAVDVFVRASAGHLAAGQASGLSAKLRSAARAKFRPPTPKPPPGRAASPRDGGKSLILIGSSTGGTEALREILVRLPKDLPPLCIVQHIPANFSGPFAERLNSVSGLAVKEAANGDVLRHGSAYVAPGDKHMMLARDTGGKLYLKIRDGGKIMHHRPSVDLMFESAAALAGPETVAGLLTGMGRDGAAGLLKLRQAGAKTFAQDEETSVVYGMPRAAAEIGAAEKILPLDEIADHIVRACGPRRTQAA